MTHDGTMRARMRRSTLFNVGRSRRRGVTVERRHATDPDAVATCDALLAENSERNEFGVHCQRYYADFTHALGDRALFLLATIEGQVAIGLMAVRLGAEAICMYGASPAQRARGTSCLVQFEAMRWARHKGRAHFDLWGGIPTADELADAESGGASMARDTSSRSASAATCTTIRPRSNAGIARSPPR